ncbi:MAG: AbiH family protein [Bacteroidota bacterium]
MDRLVIIGNGFDLAHGLPTGYRHFIDDYWEKVINLVALNKRWEDELFQVKIPRLELTHDLYSNWESVKDFDSLFAFLTEFDRLYGTSFSFHNELFRLISNQTHTENWVDIENKYYSLLKECLKYPTNEKIISVNKEFEIIKEKLSLYLKREVENNFNFSNLAENEFSKIFSQTLYENSTLQHLLKEFSGSGVKYLQNSFKEEKSNILDGSVRMRYKERININNYFLSFNYTSTIQNYTEQLKYNIFNLNEIHGRLEDDNNHINFGFGDEMDKHYQEIEEKNDNEYLRNIKSFQYLHNSNYKRLLDLIDSDKFQVYIMGHSCGLSDRTLLNTIFEHENCISIKVFYHQKDDGTDNYTEITQNISRHFNKKKLMREKIVNKTLCQPLPQIQLPKKEKTTIFK